MIYLIAVVTAPFFINVLHFAIQQGRIFGKWQKVLEFLYASKSLNFLEKPLGGCYICFSNLIAFLTIVALWVFNEKPFQSYILSYILSSFMITTITVLSVIINNFFTNKIKD